ncbi:MAG TPA: hypothetical protein VIJ23_05410 [Mycobacterium sp.]
MNTWTQSGYGPWPAWPIWLNDWISRFPVPTSVSGANQARDAEGRQDEVLERGRRGLVCVEEDFPQSHVAFGDDGVGDLLPGLEVVVERTLGDAGLPDDGGQVGVAVARVGEQLDRGVDDPAAGRLCSPACRATCPFRRSLAADNLPHSSITAAARKPGASGSRAAIP